MGELHLRPDQCGEKFDRGRQGVQPIVELAPLNECDVASNATKPERKQKQPLDYKDVATRRNRQAGVRWESICCATSHSDGSDRESVRSDAAAVVFAGATTSIARRRQVSWGHGTGRDATHRECR